MPEGHTIRSIANMWQPYLQHQINIIAPTNLVPRVEEIASSRLVNVDAKGKHLFLGFDNGLSLHIHLGRFGRFYWHGEQESITEPRPKVRLRFTSPVGWVDLVGPIAAKVISTEEQEAIEAKLGPDPLLNDDFAPARERIQKSAKPIAALLMDQDVIAGIGNIYRAELLWRSRVNPYTKGKDLSDEVLNQIWDDAKLLLHQGVEEYKTDQPTHTVGLPLPDGSNYLPQVFGKRNHTQVYQRAGLTCARCDAVIKSEDLGGRTLFYCPKCQVL